MEANGLTHTFRVPTFLHASIVLHTNLNWKNKQGKKTISTVNVWKLRNILLQQFVLGFRQKWNSIKIFFKLLYMNAGVVRGFEKNRGIEFLPK